MDKDSKHTAHIVKDWLLYYAPRQLCSPPQSPDLKVIAHVRKIMEKKVRNWFGTNRMFTFVRPVLKFFF